MPRYWICPNCGTRAIDDNGRDGLSHQQVGCAKCGFGFLFELLEDFYPPANAGFVACDRDTRVISADQNPVSVVMEGGVRKLDQPLVLRHRSGREKAVRVDLFPAYDEDGGL